MKLNGKLTLGENTADNGGAAHRAHGAAWTRWPARTPAPVDGFTRGAAPLPGLGQIWCQNATPEDARLRAQTDPHCPGRWRVNGVVSNMPEFQKAFACKAGDAMVSAKPCRVW